MESRKKSLQIGGVAPVGLGMLMFGHLIQSWSFSRGVSMRQFVAAIFLMVFAGSALAQAGGASAGATGGAGGATAATAGTVAVVAAGVVGIAAAGANNSTTSNH